MHFSRRKEERAQGKMLGARVQKLPKTVNKEKSQGQRKRREGHGGKKGGRS